MIAFVTFTCGCSIDPIEKPVIEGPVTDPKVECLGTKVMIGLPDQCSESESCQNASDGPFAICARTYACDIGSAPKAECVRAIDCDCLERAKSCGYDFAMPSLCIRARG